MATAQIKGTLEIDYNRGVIYFHNNQGVTVLRICSLPKPIPPGMLMFDITHMKGVNWK